MAKLMSFSFETVRKQLVLHLSNKAIETLLFTVKLKLRDKCELLTSFST